MKDSDLEQSITNRLRARIEAERLAGSTNGEHHSENGLKLEPTVHPESEPQPELNHGPPAEPEPLPASPEPEPSVASEPVLIDAGEPEVVPEPVATREPEAVPEPVAIAEPEVVAEPVETIKPESSTDDHSADLEPVVHSPDFGRTIVEDRPTVTWRDDPSPTTIPPPSSTLETVGDELDGRLASLSASYNELAVQVHQAIFELASRGVPFPFVVQNSIAKAHREFLKIRREVIAKLAPRHAAAIDASSILGLADLEELIARTPQTVVAPVEPPAPAKVVEREPVAVAPVVIDPPAADPIAVPIEEPVTAEPIVVEPAAEPEPVSDEEPVPSKVEEPVSERNESPAIESPPVHAPEPEQEPVASAIPKEPLAVASDHSPILLRAEETIEGILKIRLKAGKPLPEWNDAIENARALKRRIVTDSDEAPSAETLALAEGRHPMACLLTMIEQTGKLGDLEWAELYATIEEQLGKPIAMAAARNRFTTEP